MYHESSFNSWWESNRGWYESHNITKKDFELFPSKTGLNKGDIILVTSRSEQKIGDIIIFEAGAANPIIHRVIEDSPLETKGDHNAGQLSIEQNIAKKAIIGKASARIPLIGWIKLIFFEPLRPPEQRGFCN